MKDVRLTEALLDTFILLTVSKGYPRLGHHFLFKAADKTSDRKREKCPLKES